MRQRLTFYVTEEQLGYLRHEAARRRRSLSSYVADCVLEYHQRPPHADGPSESPSTPPFDVLLRESEQRVVGLITRKGASEVAQTMKRLISLTAMLDRFVMSMLIHTPEVPPPRQTDALSSAERRYRNWRRAVTEMLDEIDEHGAVWNGSEEQRIRGEERQ
jgi:hypothetical protein